MSNEIMLDFPVLKNKTGDFLEDVVYSVNSNHINNGLEITHILTGQSFIKDLLIENKAKFHVSLYFKDSKERQSFSLYYDKGKDIDEADKGLIAIQHIDFDFSYAPEITPNIVILEDIDMTVDEKSGLTDFWKIGEKLSINKYSRVASCGVLEHVSGDVRNLISPIISKDFKKGTMEVNVSINAGESERAVTVKCAENVYDMLKKIDYRTKEFPKDSEDSFKLSIISQILCSMYAEIKYQINKKDAEITNSGLLNHLDELKITTGEDYNSENFNPSLASTKMFPYITKYKTGEK